MGSERILYLDEATLRVQEASSSDDTRDNITGVLVRGDSIIATDGHILVVKPLPPSAETEVRHDGDVEITERLDQFIDPPVRLLFEDKPKVLAKSKRNPLSYGLVEIVLDEEEGRFYATSGGYASGKILTEPFADFEQVIPKPSPAGTVGLNAAYLAKIRSLLAGSQPSVQLEFQGILKASTIKGKNEDGEVTFLQFNDAVEFDGEDGDPLTCTVNIEKLVDEGFHTLIVSPDTFNLDPLAAIRVLPPEGTDGTGLGIIMPMRLD